MIFIDFKSEIKRLEDCYDKRLGNDQALIWYDKIQKWSVSRLRKSIDHLMETGEKFPVLSMLLKIGGNIQEAPSFLESVGCRDCGSTGALHAQKDYAVCCFRCNRCEIWRNRFSEVIPLWSIDWQRMGYEIVSLKEQPNNQYFDKIVENIIGRQKQSVIKEEASHGSVFDTI